MDYIYLQAYKKWAEGNTNADKRLPGLQQYSTEQMFFINYAHTWCTKMTDSYALQRVLSDVHSLGQFRYVFLIILSLICKLISVSE
jgi:membrane metallo-endopeptidase-like protein 1